MALNGFSIIYLADGEYENGECDLRTLQRSSVNPQFP